MEKPCHESWDKMTPQKEGRLCAACETTVVDFSSKSLEEIKAYFESNAGKNVCGRYQERHVADTKWNTLLNSFETFFCKVRLPKFALACITVVLFITGCHHNRKMGKLKATWASKDPKQGTEHVKGIK